MAKLTMHVCNRCQRHCGGCTAPGASECQWLVSHVCFARDTHGTRDTDGTAHTDIIGANGSQKAPPFESFDS